MSVRHTTVYLFYRSATGKRKAGSLQVQRSLILPPRLRSSEVLCHSRYHFFNRRNRYPAALQRCQRLLNGTSYGYLRVRHRPALCVSLPMNASCSASVQPSTYGYAYRACDTSTTASRVAPARPKMLSIALVLWTLQHFCMISARMRSEGYVRPSVCLSVTTFSATTRNKAAKK